MQREQQDEQRKEKQQQLLLQQQQQQQQQHQQRYVDGVVPGRPVPEGLHNVDPERATQADGRRELLSRRMFQIKRFDSAEYVLSDCKQDYVREVRGNHDKARQLHHIVDDDLTPGSPGGPGGESGATRDVGSFSEGPRRRQEEAETRSHVLPPRTRPSRLGQSDAGKRALLGRKLRRDRRFDSGDYFRGVEAEEDVVAKRVQSQPKPPPLVGPKDRKQVSPKEPTKLCKRTSGDEVESLVQRVPEDGLRQREQNEEEEEEEAKPSSKDMASLDRPPSAMMAKRILQKTGARKRWDSADYNALLSSGDDDSGFSNCDNDDTPDLDLGRVSLGGRSDSASLESKSYASDIEAREAAFRLARTGEKEAHPLVNTQSFVTPTENRAASQHAATATTTRTAQAATEATQSAGHKTLAVQLAAQQRLNKNRPRAKRFDSADFFKSRADPPRAPRNKLVRPGTTPPPKAARTAALKRLERGRHQRFDSADFFQGLSPEKRETDPFHDADGLRSAKFHQLDPQQLSSPSPGATAQRDGAPTPRLGASTLKQRQRFAARKP
ncbi:unnamed protein product [Durusdinium trenchii]|uniref:Uncharacterized protein n=1 Tax=Durusdinium trenchii TaxID=1381693 RepID=A0ABP0MNL2_9DINO